MSTRRVPRDAAEQLADVEERLRRAGGDAASAPKDTRFLYDAKGDILVAIDDNDPRPLPIGDEGQLLTVRLADDLGLRWEDPVPPPFTGKGELLVGLSAHMQALLGPGDDGQVLMVDSATPLGLRWADCTCDGGGGGGGGGPPSALGSREFAVINESTVVSDADVQAMCDAVAIQVSDHAAPAWNQLAAAVNFYPGGVGDVPVGAELVQILDDTDIPGDAGYHTIDGSDAEIIKIFAKTITDGGGGVLNGPGGGLGSYCVARVLSHEILETFIDPKVQMFAEDFGGHVWMIEVGDLVNNHGYDLGGLTVSDFGLPEWWDSVSTASSYSYDDNSPGPFSLGPGGYMFRFNVSGGATIMGSRAPNTEGELLVADPETIPGGIDHLLEASSSVRARLLMGRQPPRLRVVRGRPLDWSPGS